MVIDFTLSLLVFIFHYKQPHNDAQYRFLCLLSLLFANSTHAQKMDVIDFFKAFLNNERSPNNDHSSFGAKLVIENNSFFVNYEDLDLKLSLNVNADKTYLKYNDFMGWEGTESYPTFKIYTKADGSQILGVTEDGFRHHSYDSKYTPLADPFTYMDNPTESPQYIWQHHPRPVKFWTYKAGQWTEVTEQVMPDVYALEELVANTTAKIPKGTTLAQHVSEHINFQFYPLYRLEPNSNDITVWVDEERLKLMTTEHDPTQPNVFEGHYRTNPSTAVLADFIDNTTYRTYKMTWDAKAGKFIKNK